MPKVPIVLVGTELELRNDQQTINKLMKNKLAPITLSQGRSMAKKIGAARYVECSASTTENLNDVFVTAVRAARKSK